MIMLGVDPSYGLTGRSRRNGGKYHLVLVRHKRLDTLDQTKPCRIVKTLPICATNIPSVGLSDGGMPLGGLGERTGAHLEGSISVQKFSASII
jgi:hypothetical protein